MTEEASCLYHKEHIISGYRIPYDRVPNSERRSAPPVLPSGGSLSVLGHTQTALLLTTKDETAARRILKLDGLIRGLKKRQAMTRLATR